MSYPIPNPMFQPAMRLVIAITKSNPVVITTSTDHLYINGTIVKLHVYPENGMRQIDQQYGPITVVSPTTFSIPIDSTTYDTFVVPAMPTANNTQSCCVAIGEINSMLRAAVQNVLTPPIY